MDGQMRAAQTNEQQMEQMEPRVDAKRPPKKPPCRAISQPSCCVIFFLTDDRRCRALAASGFWPLLLSSPLICF
jgi:hypothetical protein